MMQGRRNTFWLFSKKTKLFFPDVTFTFHFYIIGSPRYLLVAICSFDCSQNINKKKKIIEIDNGNLIIIHNVKSPNLQVSKTFIWGTRFEIIIELLTRYKFRNYKPNLISNIVTSILVTIDIEPCNFEPSHLFALTAFYGLQIYQKPNLRE
jgi:hypothetical protein